MTWMNRRELLLTAGAAAGAFTSGCSTIRTAPLPSELAEDMEILRVAMAVHPGARRYITADEIEIRIKQLGQDLSASEALDERYLLFQRFLTKVKCGHTYANFYNQSEVVQANLFDRPTRLPFSFRWLAEGMVITDAAPEVDIAPGSVVTDINGVRPSEMLDTLLPYTRADGTALGKRKALLEVQGRDEIEYFDVFHGLVYGEPRDGLHHIEFISPTGSTQRRSARPIDLDERRAIRSAAESDRSVNDPIWDFEVRDGIGILTMPGWSLYKTDWDWSSWLDARLDEAAELRGLIIDNRNNEGGQIEVGGFLLSRLIREPIGLPQYRRLVRFRTFPQDLRPHAGTWDPGFFTIGDGAKDVGDGFYELQDGGLPPQLPPRGRPIDTPVILLTSPTNSSAGFLFAQVGKETGRMRLMGQETGGNLRGINGDGFFFTTLPNLGIEFDLPMVGSFPSAPQPDSGVKPDIETTETAADLAQGRDTTLERALMEF